MAKVSFTKLNKIKSIPAVSYPFGETEIEVEQYLPLEKKLDLIIAVIEQSGNSEQGFFNLVQLQTYYTIEMVKAYTNLSFTDKQMEDIPKLYDGLMLNDIWAFVEDKIPETEREYIWNNILEMANRVTEYQNSVLGILKQLSNNKESLDLDITDIMNKIQDPESLTLLKQLVDKTGLTN